MSRDVLCLESVQSVYAPTLPASIVLVKFLQNHCAVDLCPAGAVGCIVVHNLVVVWRRVVTVHSPESPPMKAPQVEPQLILVTSRS